MNEDKLILALDGGTGSFRAILFDESGNEVASNQVEWVHPIDDRYPGSIGFDYDHNWELISSCIKSLLSSNQIDPKRIKGISSTSFREGFVLYDENFQELIGFSNIDSRAEKEAAYLKETEPSLEMEIYSKTGQTFTLSAVPRLLWVKNHEPEIYEKVKYINMLNDWLIFKLTGKIVSEPSNSSTSGLFDLETRKWLPEIAEKCNLKSDIFPEVIESGEVVGNISPEAAELTGLSEESLVICGGGDSQLGCLGVGAVKDNQAVLIGGSFWQYEYNTSKLNIDNQGRIRINCHAAPNVWQYEGIAWSAGLVMRWYRDAFLELDKKLAKEEGQSVYSLMDEKVKDIPAGSYGMIMTFADVMNFHNMKHGSPTITNFTIDPVKFNKYTFYRAIMENAGLVSLGHLKMVEELTGKKPARVLFAGGSSYSKVWSQIVCDILGVELVTPKEKEATALGAAMLAGVGCGIYKDLEEARSIIEMDQTFVPNVENHKVYEEIFEKWKKVYQAQLKLADDKVTNYMWIAAGAK